MELVLKISMGLPILLLIAYPFALKQLSKTTKLSNTSDSEKTKKCNKFALYYAFLSIFTVVFTACGVTSFPWPRYQAGEQMAFLNGVTLIASIIALVYFTKAYRRNNASLLAAVSPMIFLAACVLAIWSLALFAAGIKLQILVTHSSEEANSLVGYVTSFVINCATLLLPIFAVSNFVLAIQSALALKKTVPPVAHTAETIP